MVGIRFAGNTVSGPRIIEQALFFIANTESFVVRDLPGPLTNDAKLVRRAAWFVRAYSLSKPSRNS
jgi:hypothetical protein